MYITTIITFLLITCEYFMIRDYLQVFYKDILSLFEWCALMIIPFIFILKKIHEVIGMIIVNLILIVFLVFLYTNDFSSKEICGKGDSKEVFIPFFLFDNLNVSYEFEHEPKVFILELDDDEIHLKGNKGKRSFHIRDINILEVIIKDINPETQWCITMKLE